MESVLVTGAAGFIGYHLCSRLLQEGYKVTGLDNINDYYDVNLKYARLKELGILEAEALEFGDTVRSSVYEEQLTFIRMNLEDRENLPKIFERHNFDVVINLAAQAGVRYSIENPMAYVDSNIVGFVNVLECCRNYKVPKLLYASSSSVYGNSVDVPFSTTQSVDNPISLYAATKKSNELMAYTYSHLFGIQTIGLRFFTVYDPKVSEEQIYADLDYLGTRSPEENRRLVKVVHDPYEACKGAHAVAVLTEWDEFKTYDWQRIYDNMYKPAFVFDGRNILNKDFIISIGILYYGIG